MLATFEAIGAKALQSNELRFTCKGMSPVNWDCRVSRGRTRVFTLQLKAVGIVRAEAE